MDDLCTFTRHPVAFLARYVKRRAQYGVKMLVDT
jgi:hypothetical protein